MRYQRLGNDGPNVSRICLGMMSYGTTNWQPWVQNEQVAVSFVSQALAAGINFFDTADFYSGGVSEEILGRAVKSLTTRDKVVIATKVGLPVGATAKSQGLGRAHLVTAIDASLSRLGTDYVDLYQLHGWDPTIPITETMEVLHSFVQSGKVRYVGASNLSAEQASAANAASPIKLVSMQSQYNAAYRGEEHAILPACIGESMGFIAYSPLARGFLAGIRQSPITSEALRAVGDSRGLRLFGSPADFEVLKALTEVAARYRVPSSQVALAWVLNRPGVTAAIVGATERLHLCDAIAATELQLNSEDMLSIEMAYRDRALVLNNLSGSVH